MPVNIHENYDNIEKTPVNEEPAPDYKALVAGFMKLPQEEDSYACGNEIVNASVYSSEEDISTGGSGATSFAF